MNATMSKALYFLTGALLGACATYSLLKRKYEKQTQMEIDSVKKYFREWKDSDVAYKIYSQKTENEERPIITEKEQEQERIMDDDITCQFPYVISSDSFGTFDGYDTVTLTYYSDGILAELDDEIVDDISDTIGLESLNHFGEFEDDVVFVRNNRLSTDFEVVKDLRTYEEATGRVVMTDGA